MLGRKLRYVSNAHVLSSEKSEPQLSRSQLVDMKFSSLFVAVYMVLMLPAPSVVYAQSSNSDNSVAPVTGMKPDRTTAPAGVREAMQKREAEKRKKRAECRAKAKLEKVSLVKRPAYVKKCMAQLN
jgi:hypothetical protein